MPSPVQHRSHLKRLPSQSEIISGPITYSGSRWHSAGFQLCSTLPTCTTPNEKCRHDIGSRLEERGLELAEIRRCSHWSPCGFYPGAFGCCQRLSCCNLGLLVDSLSQERISSECECRHIQLVDLSLTTRMGYTEATAGFLQSGSTVIQVSLADEASLLTYRSKTKVIRWCWLQYSGTVSTGGAIVFTTSLWLLCFGSHPAPYSASLPSTRWSHWSLPVWQASSIPLHSVRSGTILTGLIYMLIHRNGFTSSSRGSSTHRHCIRR